MGVTLPEPEPEEEAEVAETEVVEEELPTSKKKAWLPDRDAL